MAKDAGAQYDDAIQGAAKAFGVDPDILHGIAYAESRYNPKATSPKGAQGMMQFMPDTAKRFGIDPSDPEQAIFGAAQYLKENLDRFGGDYGKAVAAYNWGENRKEYEQGDWVKKLPKETDSYVEQVLSYAANRAKPAEEKAGPKPAFPGSKAHLIPGAETDVMPTPRKEMGLVERVKDIGKGLVEIPGALVGGALREPIAAGVALATGRRPEEVGGQIQPVQSEFAKGVLGGIGGALEAAKVPALTPGMLAAPSNNLVRPAIQQAAHPVVNELAMVGEAVKAPIEARRARIAAERSAESYKNAPRIEAAQDASKLGLALNPEESNPTLWNRVVGKIAGPEANRRVAAHNKDQVHQLVVEDLGLDPATTSLKGEATFNKAREQVAPAYNAVKNVELFNADEGVLNRIEGLRKDANLIGGDRIKGQIDSLVDDAIGKVGKGLTGEEVLKNVSQLRHDSKVLRNKTSVTPEDIALADTYQGIANALEELIDTNISNPKMLSDYRAARQQMAKTYAYQNATDLATGITDVSKLAKVVSQPNTFTGNLQKLGNIAANYPDAFTAKPTTYRDVAGVTFSRAGVPGTIGFAIGNAPGAILGGLAGYAGGKIAASRVARKGYQAAHAVPRDYRIPVKPEFSNQLAARAGTPNVPTVFDPRNALVQPGEMPYQPNWTVVPPRPEAPVIETPRLAAPSAEGDLAMARQQRQYEYGREAAAAERAAQAAEAEAAATRKPATGGQVYELDPVTGKLRTVDQGLKGATPEVIRDTGANLASAAEKVAGGQKFAMSAAEKIAWDRTKVDLAELAPGFDKLSDKAIAERMADRNWAQQMVQKARDQARAFEDIAARAADERARQEAFAARERMMDLAEMLDEQLRVVKPKKLHQGPKTREAKRNALRGSIDNLNALVQ